MDDTWLPSIKQINKQMNKQTIIQHSNDKKTTKKRIIRE